MYSPFTILQYDLILPFLTDAVISPGISFTLMHHLVSYTLKTSEIFN